MPGTERRNSSSSEDASVPPRQILLDGTELIPTRTMKSTAPKPAANPLQFIKVGPCDLYKAAQEQIKKVEEIKKVEKTVKEDSEDWQSNLDNWKCSRRKRQEHIIDRVVEVKKLELEEQERNRRRGKTLNEMIEERSQKGVGPRKMSLLTYPEDDANDLSDLGIGVNSSDTATDNEKNDSENNKVDDNDNAQTFSNKNGTNGHGESPEPEYTYERAIEGYKSFAEKKVKAVTRQRVSPPKKETGSKIGEKLNELEQVRLRSNSVNDINLPKVDIHKRRSLFEVVETAETKSTSAERVTRDLGSANIVRDRLSSLERNVEPIVKTSPRPQEEISVSLKDRLSSLEKQKAAEITSTRRISNGDIGHISIKERLSSLEKHQHGVKDNSNGNLSSDEDVGQKLLLSPTNSEREVSSPLVSQSYNTVNVDDSCNTNQVIEEVVKNYMVEGSNSGLEDVSGSTMDNTAEQFKSVLKDSSVRVTVVETDQNEAMPVVELQSSNNEGLDESAIFEMPIENKTEKDVVDLVIEPPEDLIEQKSDDGNGVRDELGAGEHVNELLEFTKTVIKSPEPTNENMEMSTVEQTTIKNKELVLTLEKQQTLLKSEDTITKKVESQFSPAKVLSAKTKRTIVKKPQVRVRKLTPISTAPILSPVKTPTDLEIISEDASITALTEDVDKPTITPRITIQSSKVVQGAETSESGIDMEESSLYTDENIDEVLAEDDVDENECPPSVDDDSIINDTSQGHEKDEKIEQANGFDQGINLNHQDPISRFDDLINLNTDNKYAEKPASNNIDMLKIENSAKNVELFKISENVSEMKVDDLLCFEEPKNSVKDDSFALNTPSATENKPSLELVSNIKPAQPPVLYENIILTENMAQLNLMGDVVGFPLSPSSCIEPPKEKPPPPPVDLSDEEDAPELPPKKASLRRLDSTKRIKKEIRKKRSDFLGIEGTTDDSYLEPEVDVAPPPDMLTFLQEERRLDQQMYRQSLCSDADSAEGTERGNAVDRLDKALFLDQGLYRQSICSETDSNHETAESRDSGVELDRGHADDLCWAKQSGSPDELSHPHSRQNSEPYGNVSVTSEEDEIMKKEREIIEALEKEEEWRYGKPGSGSQQNDIGEKLAVKLRELEKEKMQLEWERAEEEGRRMADEERLQAKEIKLRQQETSSNLNKTATVSQENLRSERERLEKEQVELVRAQQELYHQKRRSADPPRQGPMSTNLRYSMPDLQGDVRPQVPAPKPTSTWNRVPSADNLLAPQQMTRTTLHALSATPRNRLVAGEAWMQPKKKQPNYQHWLIQEAEHRRITEQQQRANQSRRSLPNQMRSPNHFSSNQPLPRPNSGQFSPSHAPVPHYPLGPTPYSPPPINHTRATSNPIQTPPPSHTHTLSHPVTSPSHHTVGLPPSPHVSYPQSNHQNGKPLPDSVIQTLTQRVQNKSSPRRRVEERPPLAKPPTVVDHNHLNGEQERMLSVSGKKKCSHCSEELGRGAAMVIESLRLFYHIDCFKCCVCHSQLGDGLMGTDVRVRNNKLHCHNCYSSDDGVKFSCV